MNADRLVVIRNRLAARLPGLPGLTIEQGPCEEWPVALQVSSGGKAHAELPLDAGPWTEDSLVDEACEICGGALPEVVLTQDTALCLNGFTARVAERRQAVESRPRPPVDPSQPYTAEQAEADISRIARDLAHAYTDGIDDCQSARLSPDDGFNDYEARYMVVAVLMLSKLHGWKLGAPDTSPGHQYARAVYDAGGGGGV